MEKEGDLLKRYYQGWTTVPEEKQLKANWLKGELTENAIFSLQEIHTELPTGLTENIQQQIQQKRQHKIRQIWITTGTIAAIWILILSFRNLLAPTESPGLQLSDNLKKERFENALRVIGNALEENTPPTQQVLYEDHKLIITIE